jgi:diguanylate cyclase (GGDEF)-like protein
VTASSSPPSVAPGIRTRRSTGAAATGAPHDWISHSLRHLERWVGWSIAVYTAWLAVFAFPGVPALWALALYAGLVGKWAEACPARHQTEMAWRGAALIAGAYVIHTHSGADVGGPGGPFFFWLSITCLYYAFMLKPAWAAGLVAFALVEFAAAGWQASSVSVPDLLAQGAFLCIFPLLLAMKFGSVMRRPDEALENGRIDSATALYNKQGLSELGDEMLAAAQRDNRPIAVAVFDCSDLLEVRTIYGSRIARKLLARIVRKLMSMTADRGLAARTGPAEFTVVLPGMSREKALAAIHKVLGNPSRIELDAGDSEIVLVPSFLVDIAGADAASVDELCRELRSELVQIGRDEQRRHHHMRRERERHSRPMPLHSQPLAADATRSVTLYPDATLPVALAA